MERSGLRAISAPAALELSNLLRIKIPMYPDGCGMTGVGGFDRCHRFPTFKLTVPGMGVGHRDPNALQ